MAEHYFTEEGFKKIKQEIEELERFIKIDVARDIGTAAAHGDLRENAEYAAAKEKQQLAIGKMRELQARIRDAEIVRRSDFPADIVTLCKRVKIKNVDTGEEDVYTILGDGESDLDRGIISYQTALAAALIGKKVGEVAEMELPAGTTRYEILEIAFLDEA